MIKILFVCLGNICRSPMAEFVLCVYHGSAISLGLFEKSNNLKTLFSLSSPTYIDKSDNKGHIYNHIEEVMRGEMPTQEIKNFYKDNSINIFRDAIVKKDASGVIKNLMDEGRLEFITHI